MEGFVFYECDAWILNHLTIFLPFGETAVTADLNNIFLRVITKTGRYYVWLTVVLAVASLSTG